MSDEEFGFYCISNGGSLNIFEHGSDLIRIVPIIDLSNNGISNDLVCRE